MGEWNTSEQQARLQLLKQALSIFISFTPAGLLSDIIGVATGEDAITGDQFSGWERAMIAATLIVPGAGKFLGEVVQAADSWVVKYGVRGTIDAAEAAARNGDAILPGLFRYGDSTMEPIAGYQRHHLWPRGLGGPEDGWAIYVQISPENLHTSQAQGIRTWLNNQLIERTGLGNYAAM